MNTRDARAELERRGDWRKAQASQGANACVEIAHSPGWVGIRDSKLGATSPLLALTPEAWQAFLASEQRQ